MTNRVALDILADILQNSTFAEDDLEREREVILQEIAAIDDSPDDLVFDLINDAAFTGPSSRPADHWHPQKRFSLNGHRSAGVSGPALPARRIWLLRQQVLSTTNRLLAMLRPYSAAFLRAVGRALGRGPVYRGCTLQRKIVRAISCDARV